MIVYSSVTGVTRLEKDSYNLLPDEISGIAAETAKMKDQLCSRISVIAAQKIVNGFQSNALGTLYWYDSTIEDQQNLQGVVSLSVSFSYPTRVTQTGEKIRRNHTAVQLKQVLLDGATVKQGILVQSDALKTFVRNASVEVLRNAYGHFSDDSYIWGLV